EIAAATPRPVSVSTQASARAPTIRYRSGSVTREYSSSATSWSRCGSGQPTCARGPAAKVRSTAARSASALIRSEVLGALPRLESPPALQQQLAVAECDEQREGAEHQAQP